MPSTGTIKKIDRKGVRKQRDGKEKERDKDRQKET